MPRANAPQKVTRNVARKMFAPPAFAPIAPNKARKPNDAADTIGTSTFVGETTTISNGMAAPTENITADVSAACTGRAVVISEIPSSSRAWAVSEFFGHQLSGDLLRGCRIDATLDVDFGKFVMLGLRIITQFPAFTREVRVFSVRL